MAKTANLGMEGRLALVVFFSVFLSAIAIITTLYLFNQKRLYRDTLSQSEGMIQAASLAFSQAIAQDDEVLLDALLHELESRAELHILKAYVIDPDGRVIAHTDLDEYGKTYSVPALMKSPELSRSSEITENSGGSFSVLSLLQGGGKTMGALIVSFSTEHLARKLRAEMGWMAFATLPVFILFGLGVVLYGRRMALRLRRLQDKAVAIGRGEWGDPMEVTGSDEIAQLTESFNQMLSDLLRLREKERSATGVIEKLNRDLSDQLEKVEGLKERLLEENAALRDELLSESAAGEIIGSEGSIRHVVEQARQLASLPVTVLVSGESGTGKELIARLLHESGSRSEGPFVAVNCAAMPSPLIESELFGHEKGAFTGAFAAKKGKFELVDGGTLFLDEVGELPLEVQAKLLRAIQHGEVNRIGGERPVSVDVRIVAATNRALEEEVASGNFREDLYYRLRVVELHCPPLRERIEDLSTLAQHFIEVFSKRLDKPVRGIAPSALSALMSYDWPGNIRELENMVARAVALATTQVLGPEDFIFESAAAAPLRAQPKARDAAPFERLLGLCRMTPDELRRGGFAGLVSACERICIFSALDSTKSQKEAAEKLGMTPTKLHRLIRKHGLKARR